ncbi:Uu.00g008670.m01.CDS01 [Anthostomella pinea]|uniref:Uu.00g008670.m01.CDS01 n=1 Tax=Anthostomella pinea TaxID=933095 RepID=A0AAI8VYG8_9PEZI|nr:Uu.00g008670.m01.CDS01 [Anthostomella pinea]
MRFLTLALAAGLLIKEAAAVNGLYIMGDWVLKENQKGGLVKNRNGCTVVREGTGPSQCLAVGNSDKTKSLEFNGGACTLKLFDTEGKCDEDAEPSYKTLSVTNEVIQKKQLKKNSIWKSRKFRWYRVECSDLRNSYNRYEYDNRVTQTC